MIYFLQSPDGGPLKIGYTSHVDRRRMQLETIYGRPLVLLGVIEGGRQEEAEIHERFADHRLGRTEQFHPVPEILDFIGRPLFASTVEAEPMPPVGCTVALIHLKGSPAFSVWLEGLRRHTHMQKTVMFRLAIAEFAKQQGYDVPPPEL